MRMFFLLVLFVLAQPLQAAVYKCVIDGEVTFAGKPCAADAVPIDVRVSRPSESEAIAAQRRLQSAQKHNDLQGVERRIVDLERDIDKYQREVDSEVDVLKRKKSLANNNLAGAAWKQSLSAEMQAVVDKYQGKINGAQGEIASYRKRVAALR